MPDDRGPVLNLAAGPYTATVGPVGASLRGLRHTGRDLTYGLDSAVPTPPFAGAVLAPWPNRIRDGRYRFDGRTHQLPVDEVERRNALHGLALWEQWSVAEQSAESASFEHVLWPRPGYPFTVALRTSYTLGAGGLRIEVAATNVGTSSAPVGLSAHPYLSAGVERLDEWRMQLPCTHVIATDDRLLPQHTDPVADVDLDFRAARRIGAAVIDHAFTGVAFDAGGQAEATLVGTDGTGVRVRWDRACDWLQVYTLHVPGTPMHRRAVAVEPMTCPPDAFNSGTGLAVLAPGASTSMWFEIAALDPGGR